jgi:TonB-dependent receptor
VATQTESTGSFIQRQTIDNPAGGAPITEEVSTTVVSVDRQYEDYLPSFNLQYEITDKLITRFSAAKVLARPRPFDLRPNANCVFDRTASGIGDADLDDCTAGNPALEPYRANQYDITVSYYANRDTLLNASYFRKDIESFIVQNVLTRGVDLFGDGRLFDVTQPGNVAGAKITGLELSAQTVFTFLPAPFDGFGAQVNYTFSTAENVGLFNQLTFEELPFPGLSEHSYNIVAFYDQGPWNARVAYQYRTEYLLNPAERSGNPTFRDATGYLDGRIAYRFGENVTVFAEAKNLTDEVERTTSGDIRLTEAAWSGRRYFVGFTWRN